MKGLRYFSRSLVTVVGIVLVWRGIWNLLDLMDAHLFGENFLVTSIGGIIVGLLMLYLPDKDLKEIDGPLRGSELDK